MFTRILVPLDGSLRAETALTVAARIARAGNGHVVLVQALSVPSEYLAPMAPVNINTTLLEAEQQETEAYLTGIAESPTFAGIQVETSVLVGPAAPLLIEEIMRKQADLVVMCSHGRTGFTRWMLGSVAQQLTRHASVPVVVLRDQGPSLAPHPDQGAPLRVLVPVDGSDASEAATGPAAWLAAALAAPQQPELHLFYVVNAFESEARQQPESMAAAGAKAYLAKLAERLVAQHPSVRVTWSAAVDQDVAEIIITTAEKGETEPGPAFDLVVMATHGRTGFARWAMGSVTERVLWSTRIPLLIVRPKQAATSPIPADSPEAESAMQDWPGLQ